jgi:hypothetical protein
MNSKIRRLVVPTTIIGGLLAVSAAAFAAVTLFLSTLSGSVVNVLPFPAPEPSLLSLEIVSARPLTSEENAYGLTNLPPNTSCEVNVNGSSNEFIPFRMNGYPGAACVVRVAFEWEGDDQVPTIEANLPGLEVLPYQHGGAYDPEVGHSVGLAEFIVLIPVGMQPGSLVFGDDAGFTVTWEEAA